MFFGFSILFSFEVNTHQALTRCAITNSCGNGKAENLISFVNHASLNTLNASTYESVSFDGYNKTYEEYVEGKTDSGFDKWNIAINANYLGMIEAGSVLEDAVYSIHDHEGDGRFNNHFYAAQFHSRNGCLYFAFLKTSKALCNGYGIRTDNIDWAFNDNVTLGAGRKNDYGLSDAFLYYKKSFIGSATDRRKYQAKLFVSLGHIVHLLQDLHSPAHCRDNSHVDGDYLEIYGRYDGGFNLKGGVFNSANNPNIVNGIRTNGNGDSLVKLNRYASYEDFFKKEVTWVGYNFASESHFNWFVGNPDKQTGAGLSVNNSFDSSSLFDGRNVYPSKSTTYESGNISGLDDWAYVYTEGNVISNSVKGYISPSYRKISLVNHGLIFDDYHMIAPNYTWVSGGVELKVTSLNQKPLEDTAVNVMPRAVASTQAFINFFFRGQIDVSIDTKGILTIKNISNAQSVSDARLLTFKSGGKFKIYYRDATTGNNNPLNTLEYTFGDIAVGETRTLDLRSDFLKKNLAEGTKITVLYDGKIGTDLGGSDSYGIGMRGLSVDVVSLPTITKPVPDSYSYSVSLRIPAIKPDRYHPTTYHSYDVDKYKNGKYVGRYKLDNLLKIVWYTGAAHFGDSRKNHLDIWCEGNAKLCNYLRLTVPTDSTVGYENWDIDWTVWSYGGYINNLTLFIQNIRRQIGQYYVLTSNFRQKENKGIAFSKSFVDTSDWYAGGEGNSSKFENK